MQRSTWMMRTLTKQRHSSGEYHDELPWDGTGRGECVCVSVMICKRGGRLDMFQIDFSTCEQGSVSKIITSLECIIKVIYY